MFSDDETKEQLAVLNEQAIERVASAKRRLKANPNDAEALYIMSVSYNYGWGGLPENKHEANVLLLKAAALGHLGACEESNRIDANLKSAQEQKDLTIKNQENAKLMFDNRLGLEDAIKAEIIPCLVSLKTEHGLGSGFFQHQRWLVTNAHVLQNSDILSGVTLTDFQSKEFQITAQSTTQNFPRPNQRGIPDITVVNIESNSTQKSLRTKFSGDEAYDDLIAFYVYFSESTQKYEIKYLDPIDKLSLPLQYKTEENPEPGCSGSPIIEARVILGREPKWQFRAVGAVYAKRPGASHPSQGSDKLLAIPVCYDFTQILEIITSMDLAVRCEQMVKMCNLAVQDSETQRRKEELFAQYRLYIERVERLLQAYSEGKAPMSIDSLESDELLVKKLEQQANANLIRKKEELRVNEAQTHSSSWDIGTVRELSEILFLDKLHGINLNHPKAEGTKLIFSDPISGWSIVHDKAANYNTVHNENGTYVARDKSLSSNGTEGKFHFTNKPS